MPAASPFWLLVIGVATTVAAVAFGLLDRAEQREFEVLVNIAHDTEPAAAPASDAQVLSIMSTVNSRLKSIRVSQPGAPDNGALEIISSHEQLINPAGACASYSHVLAKSLMTAGYQVRKVGLTQGSKRAIHHVIEAHQGDSWVLLDAYYNLAFRARDGHLASAAEVSRDWAWFRTQVPADYDPAYDYSGFYYTNWDRIPVLGRIIRSIPSLDAWLYNEGISLRFWVFNTYRWLAATCALIALACWFIYWRIQRQQRAK